MKLNTKDITLLGVLFLIGIWFVVGLAMYVITDSLGWSALISGVFILAVVLNSEYNARQPKHPHKSDRMIAHQHERKSSTRQYKSINARDIFKGKGYGTE